MRSRSSHPLPLSHLLGWALVACLGTLAPHATDRALAEDAAEEGAAVEAAPPTVDEVLEGLKAKGEEGAGARLEAAVAALELDDDRLITPLGRLLTDDTYAVRAAARAALAARLGPTPRKKATKLLAARLGPLEREGPGSQGELIQTIDALRELQHPSSISTLSKLIGHDTPLEVVESASLAIANVAEPEAIEELIDLLAGRGKRSGGHRNALVKALRSATGERIGNDPDAWRSWWRTNEKTFDFESAAEQRDEARAKEQERAERRRRRDERGGGNGGGRRRPREGGDDS